MIDELIALLESYLEEESEIQEISDWIAVNLWDASEDVSELIDQIAVELAYIDDNVSDERHFRTRVSEILTSFKVSP